jgi:hypothetical protein
MCSYEISTKRPVLVPLRKATFNDGKLFDHMHKFCKKHVLRRSNAPDSCSEASQIKSHTIPSTATKTSWSEYSCLFSGIRFSFLYTYFDLEMIQ